VQLLYLSCAPSAMLPTTASATTTVTAAAIILTFHFRCPLFHYTSAHALHLGIVTLQARERFRSAPGSGLRGAWPAASGNYDALRPAARERAIAIHIARLRRQHRIQFGGVVHVGTWLPRHRGSARLARRSPRAPCSHAIERSQCDRATDPLRSKLWREEMAKLSEEV
jgi:hypothetical protein